MILAFETCQFEATSKSSFFRNYEFHLKPYPAQFLTKCVFPYLIYGFGYSTFSLIICPPHFHKFLKMPL